MQAEEMYMTIRRIAASFALCVFFACVPYLIGAK
jgi:hypothetical protein